MKNCGLKPFTVFNQLLKLLFFISLFLFSSLSYAQNPEQEEHTEIYRKAYYAEMAGDHLKAKKVLEPLTLLERDQIKFSPTTIFQMMGWISIGMLDYSAAIRYVEKAEEYAPPPEIDPYPLLYAYNTRVMIYQGLKDYYRALLYLEKTEDIIKKYGDGSNEYDIRMMSLNNQKGYIYYKLNQYDSARFYTLKGMDFYKDNNFSMNYSEYSLLGKIADRQLRYKEAEDYYTYAIEKMIENFGPDYSSLLGVYLEYAELLTMTCRFEKVEELLRKSINIAFNTAEHYSKVASSYQILGDYYSAISKYDSALFFYQVALNCLYPELSSIEINKNPPAEGCPIPVRFLEILEHKANALYLKSIETEDIAERRNLLKWAIESVDLAIRVKSKTQNSLISNDSRMFLSGTWKSLYSRGIKYSLALSELSQGNVTSEKAWYYASLYKAEELRKNLLSRKSVKFMEAEDSLFIKLDLLKQSIRQYSNYIAVEENKPGSDPESISNMRSELFTRNLEYDSITKLVKDKAWYKLLNKEPETESLQEIQKKLGRKQAIIDYVITPPDEDSASFLYIFVIDRKNIRLKQSGIESRFKENLNYYLSAVSRDPVGHTNYASYDSLKLISNYLYNRLVKPVEPYIQNKEIIIIPDEKLLLLPFESLLSEYTTDSIINYSSLPYLVKTSAISYALSTDLLFRKKEKTFSKPFVLAFAPFASEAAGTGNAVLDGATAEIREISELLRGDFYLDSSANKSAFLDEYQDHNIYHFALHSDNEAANERESYLEFYPKDSLNKLWSYEVSFLDLPSPFVVLSSCNTGTGTINISEGVFSMGRSFFEAGAISVVQTLWYVNDGSSSEIFRSFYRELASGETKTSALQLAKKDYLSESSSFFAHPYYWAGIQLLGNNKALAVLSKKRLIVIGGLLSIIILAYLFRRSIFRRRSSASA